MSRGLLHCIWNSPSIPKQFQAAVSLHSHTHYSRESLDFIPRYAERVPGLSRLLRLQEVRYEQLHGRKLDFQNTWWTPPLSAREAYDLERRQIEDGLGLRSMVSLTDHDDIEAPSTLHVLPEMRDVPISLEWSAPYGPSFFHIGVHNLPAPWAHDVVHRLLAYTTSPDERDLPELFSILHGFPSTLLVFNHPLWDEPQIGQDRHRNLLVRFLARHREWIHALELNGLRSWQENKQVVEMADDWSLPVISGGDRHGLEPNSVVNLTNAATFDEFAAEVRCDYRSEVLFLQQWREPLRVRVMQTLIDVLQDYPDFPAGRRRWSDRVFYQNADGVVRPLSACWPQGEPAMVKLFVRGVRLLQSNRVQSALRAALDDKQEAAV